MADKKDFMRLLNSMGITNYEPAVVLALEEYSRRVTTELLCEAKDYSNHAGKLDVDEADLKIALQLRNRRNFEASQNIRKVQQEINNAKLPDIPIDPANVRYLRHPAPLVKRSFTYIPGIQAYPEPDSSSSYPPTSTSSTSTSSHHHHIPSKPSPSSTSSSSTKNPSKNKIPINISSTRFEENR